VLGSNDKPSAARNRAVRSSHIYKIPKSPNAREQHFHPAKSKTAWYRQVSWEHVAIGRLFLQLPIAKKNGQEISLLYQLVIL